MPVLSPQFLFSVESSLIEKQELEYQRLVESGNLWWDQAMRLIPTQSGREVIAWVLNNALLEGTGLDPSARYRSMSILETSFVPEYISSALELQKAQFEDLQHPNGLGIDIASEWVQQIGFQSAYYPQRVAARLLLDGYTGNSTGVSAASNGIGYDGLQFFTKSHPLNAKNSAVGKFANVFTGNVGSGDAADVNAALYPGKIDIRIGTGGITADTAFAALQNAFKYIMSIKMPNGVDPRFLRPRATLLPSTLWPYMSNLLDAKFISMASSGSGGGTTDISGQLQKMGYGTPLLAPELDSDPTTFYIVADQMASSQMGGLVYLERQPVAIRYHDPNTSSYLDDNDLIHWVARGRAVGGYGHPYYIFQCRAV